MFQQLARGQPRATITARGREKRIDVAYVLEKPTPYFSVPPPLSNPATYFFVEQYLEAVCSDGNFTLPSSLTPRCKNGSAHPVHKQVLLEEGSLLWRTLFALNR